ncbi:MAG: hypothetical protein ACRDQF_14705 [Thermocrispum sp.]
MIPDAAGLLSAGRYHLLRATVEPLDAVLASAGAAPMHVRRPVLAVGSNAAPAQLLHKLGPSAVLPMTLARVGGLAAGVSAHVSHGRYIPAAPIAAPGELHRLLVLWPDDQQLAALDRTEPNYRRTVLGPQFTVMLRSGGRCEVYVSRWGCLLDGGGQPRRLGSQRDLLAAVLAGSAELRALFGQTPQDFVAAAAHADRRARAREIFAAAGWVAAQPELLG